MYPRAKPQFPHVNALQLTANLPCPSLPRPLPHPRFPRPVLCLWAIAFGGGVAAAADLSQYAVPFYLRNLAGQPIRLYWIGTSYILDQTIAPVINATTVSDYPQELRLPSRETHEAPPAPASPSRAPTAGRPLVRRHAASRPALCHRRCT